MRKQREFEYTDEDGKTTKYLITAFPAFGGATSGFKIKADLAKLAVPFFTDLRGEGDVIENKDPLQVAVEGLMSRLDSDAAEVLVLRMLSGVTKGSMALNPMEEFSADYAKLYKVLYEVVDLNFGSVVGFLGTVSTESPQETGPLDTTPSE